MVEFTMKQLKQMAKEGLVEDITKADGMRCKSIQEKEKRLCAVGASSGCYGISGKMWKGETTGTLYVATDYAANIYRF